MGPLEWDVMGRPIIKCEVVEQEYIPNIEGPIGHSPEYESLYLLIRPNSDPLTATMSL